MKRTMIKLSGQNAEFVDISAGGKYSNQYALRS
jgi:hypothetical protein